MKTREYRVTVSVMLENAGGKNEIIFESEREETDVYNRKLRNAERKFERAMKKLYLTEIEPKKEYLDKLERIGMTETWFDKETGEIEYGVWRSAIWIADVVKYGK